MWAHFQLQNGGIDMFVTRDTFSKWVEAFAVPDQAAATTARIILNEIVCRYGLPEGLHSDQGRNFEAKLLQELCSKLGVKRTRTPPYNPQCKRMNRTLAERIALLIEAQDQRDWDQKLPSALSAKQGN